MSTTYAYAATAATAPLAPFEIQRRELRAHDVQMEVLFCGVCHSDLHQARNEWQNTVFPVVPGHEIVGRVTAVGPDVTKYKAGDLVGVGCLVDSCRTCASCEEGLEQYCENGFVGTYNGMDRVDGQITYGGYSTQLVVDEAFTLHMGVKLARAMGAHVVLFTTSPSKIEDAKRLGAHEVVISKNAQEMEAHANSFDLIVNTVAAQHDLNPFLNLLKRDGTMTLVGAPEHDHPSPQVFNLIMKRRRLAGSLIGGIAETQEMLDFCGEHGITSDIELIPMQQINEAYERMLKSDVKYRFVIDLDSLRK
jgi:uncharacterized zinc-type alcohol dehydrogenase-like protein